MVNRQRPIGLTEDDIYRELLKKERREKPQASPCQCGHDYEDHDRHGSCWECGCTEYRDA